MSRQHLKHENRVIPYEIAHQARVTRRIHLKIAADGGLLVIAPRRMGKRLIHQSLRERSHKVVQFLDQALARHKELPNYSYREGEEHLYLGRKYPLALCKAGSRSRGVSLEQDRIRIVTPDSGAQTVSRKLSGWYRERALEYFSGRMVEIGREAAWVTGVAPPLRLRKMKRTWGSCSARGVITLNPKLVKAPGLCIDYVISHELCHLREMNHGKAFYALLAALCPNWRAARSSLHERAHIYLYE